MRQIGAAQHRCAAAQRVVLYRNGVGYFERAGHVDEEEVRFKMRDTEVGDFLASLAVIEQGGSSVKAAAFPVEDPNEITDDSPKPTSLMTTDEKRGLKIVVLSLDGKEHDLQVGYIAASPCGVRRIGWWCIRTAMRISKHGASCKICRARIGRTSICRSWRARRFRSKPISERR